MRERPGNLVQHLLSRAVESLEEARILAGTGHWNTCVSRLYYACFHAVSGLLEKHGFSASKHSGVRSLFNVHFVKTGMLSKEVGAIYNDLFDRRQESDYGPFFIFEEVDVKPWLDEVVSFVAAVKKLIEQSPENS
jgi:uncharacterized protein (UPF0332 family)